MVQARNSNHANHASLNLIIKSPLNPKHATLTYCLSPLWELHGNMLAFPRKYHIITLILYTYFVCMCLHTQIWGD
jgi:hypothetical protein